MPALALAGTVQSQPPASAATAAPNNVAASAPKPLAPVVINGVLFRAVEFDAGKVIWRNLAVTVTADRIDAWRALPAATKNQYAAQMIENYRSGMKFDRDIKLTFIDESNTTLDQYLWTPPQPERK